MKRDDTPGDFAGLFTDDGTDPLSLSPAPPPPKQRSARVRTANDARHIGCPMWWFKLAVSRLNSAAELAVALYLYRLRVVQRSRTVALSNERLFAELGVTRYSKYNALQKLADAGVIRIRQQGRRATVVTFIGKKHGGQR